MGRRIHHVQRRVSPNSGARRRCGQLLQRRTVTRALVECSRARRSGPGLLLDTASLALTRVNG
jgi:hypothetical protein